MDGMHGSKPDTGMAVTHFGARHMALRGDGMLLQPRASAWARPTVHGGGAAVPPSGTTARQGRVSTGSASPTKARKPTGKSTRNDSRP